MSRHQWDDLDDHPEFGARWWSGAALGAITLLLGVVMAGALLSMAFR